MVLGVLFGEPALESLASQLAAFSHPFPSNLLQAKVRAAMVLSFPTGPRTP